MNRWICPRCQCEIEARAISVAHPCKNAMRGSGGYSTLERVSESKKKERV